MSQLFDDAPQNDTYGAPDGEAAQTAAHGTFSNSLFGEHTSTGTGEADDGFEAEFAVPEGIHVNAALMAEFRNTASELGLDHTAAQRLVDLQVKNTQAQLEAFHQMRAEWRSEFPGGASNAVVQDAAYVLRRFDADGALARELAETGQGDNPKVIRFLAAIRKEFKEDAVYTGENARQDGRPLRERLWPDETMPR